MPKVSAALSTSTGKPNLPTKRVTNPYISMSKHVLPIKKAVPQVTSVKTYSPATTSSYQETPKEDFYFASLKLPTIHMPPVPNLPTKYVAILQNPLKVEENTFGFQPLPVAPRNLENFPLCSTKCAQHMLRR
eukprot:15359190-Ditylum_brightwellii.AAC.1